MCQKTKLPLHSLRDKFLDLNIHAIVIPSSDPHQSEYPCKHWMLRQWISGFTGSAGTVVITRDKAGLWTDSRYFIQAEQELQGSEFILFRQGQEDTPSINEFLRTELSDGQVVALNYKMWSQADIESIQEYLIEYGIHTVLEHQPAEVIWDEFNRPKLPVGTIFEHDPIFAGASVQEKLSLVRSEMKQLDVRQHLVTTLDDIAWLFNLRGNDVDFNPIFLSYAIIESEKATVFVDIDKIDSETRMRLDQQEVSLEDYNKIDKHLTRLTDNILVNPADCNGYLFKCIPSKLMVAGQTISRLLKARKNNIEISHIEHAMVKDAKALAKAFHHLYQNLGKITEAMFAKYIAQMRSAEDHYYGESFPAIVGYQSNGAIVHYRPQKGESAIIQPEGLLLCDSGGQYYDGTTDITRTIAVGPLTEEQKVNYTNVLKGHIAIDQAIFPTGTAGGQLDPLARQFLWNSGKNFGHGTGHGVGYFLNVHEPPQGISPGVGSRSTTPFEVGMITSNEPGYYEENSYGIRIENLIVCEESDFEGYLKHRHLTLFPIDTTPIIRDMMTKSEILWINQYHELVQHKILHHLPKDLQSWFRNLCQKI